MPNGENVGDGMSRADAVGSFIRSKCRRAANPKTRAAQEEGPSGASGWGAGMTTSSSQASAAIRVRDANTLELDLASIYALKPYASCFETEA